MFLLLCSLIICERVKKCTPKRTLFDITTKNYNQIVGGDRPVFLRLVKAGCSYAKTSQPYWEKSAQLYPTVQYARIDCSSNYELCARYNAEISPSHAVIAANSTKVRTFFTNPDEISQSAQYFNDVVSQNFKIYSFDTPSVEDLLPQNAHDFFLSSEFSIFILYDSNCYEDLDMVSTWITKVTDGQINAEDISVGKLDCSKYPNECLKWGATYPSANVFSRSRATSVAITETDHLQKRIEKVISYLRDNKERYPTPVPEPRIPQITPRPDLEGYKKITLEALEQRSVEECKNKYIKAKRQDYKGNEWTNTNDFCIARCETVTLNKGLLPEVLKHINYFRDLVGLYPRAIVNNQQYNAACDQAARYLSLVNRLTHNPNANDVKKYCGFNSDLVIEGCRNSNLAQSHNSNSIWNAMSGLMTDEGDNNEGVIGHRRWFLYPYLQKVGFGYYPKSSLMNGNIRMSYPCTLAVHIHDQPTYQIPYNLTPFIAYPPPGPFPLEILPTSWTIYYQEFQKFEDGETDCLIVRLTRDDGIALDYQQLYMNVKNNLAGLGGCLVIKIPSKTVSLITPGHSVHVQVYIDKNESRHVIDYTTEFYDLVEETRICYYNTDKTKCPSTIPDNLKFGPGEYQKLVTKTKRTHIQVAEKITLNETLNLNFSQEVFVRGEPIEGTVNIGIGYKVDFSNPSETDIYMPVEPYRFRSGVVYASRAARSVTLNFTTAPNARNSYRTLFYVGPYTEFHYPKRDVDADGEYRYFFSITHSGSEFSFACLSLSDYEYACMMNAADYEEYIDPTIKCTVFSSFNELRNLRTNKKVIRVYADGQVNFSSSGLAPNSYHDYELYIYSDIQLQYSHKVNLRARSITIRQLKNKEITVWFKAQSRIYGEWQNEKALSQLPFKNVTIYNYRPLQNGNNVEPLGTRISGIKGDYNAIKDLYYDDSYVLFDETKAPFAKDDGSFFVDSLDYPTNIPIAITNGRHSVYKLSGANGHSAFRFRPTPQTAFKKTQFDIIHPKQGEGRFQGNNPFMFENYKDLVIRGGISYMPYNASYGFFYIKHNSFGGVKLNNIGKVRFVNITDVSKPVQEGLHLDITGKSDVDISSDDAEAPTTFTYIGFRLDKTVVGTNTAVVESHAYDCNLKIKNMKFDSYTYIHDSHVTYVNCTIKNLLYIYYSRGENTPFMYLQNCTFNPSEIHVLIHSMSYITGFKRVEETGIGDNLLISGLDPIQAPNILKKVTIDNPASSDKLNTDYLTNYKAILTADKKGIMIVNKIYGNTGPNVPPLYDNDNPDNFVEEPIDFHDDPEEAPIPGDEKDDNFQQPLSLNPPPPEGTLPPESNKGAKAGVIAGSVIGVIVVLGAAAAVVAFFIIKKRKITYEKSTDGATNEQVTTTDQSNAQNDI